jgi:hypothetical protein
MTALQAPSTDEILAQAREVKFSQVATAVVLWLFWMPGWVAGRSWLALVFSTLWVWHHGLVFAAIAIRRGWRDGTDSGPRQRMAVSRGPDNSKVLLSI